MSQGFEDHPTPTLRFDVLRIHRIQYITVSMTTIYYNKSIQSKTAKEKVQGTKSRGIQAQASRVLC